MRVALVCLGLTLSAALPLLAESSRDSKEILTDESVAVRTEGTHQLLLPKDWPVQQKDGHIAPAPIEEYMSMKFGQVRARFSQADDRMGLLERQIAALEKGQHELLRGLKALEERLQQKEADDGHKTQSSSQEAGQSAPGEP